MALLTNLLSYWKLDEASGDRFDSHSTNTLSAYNAPVSATGKINSGVQCASSGTKALKRNHDATISWGYQEVSFSCWVKFDVLLGRAIFSKGTTMGVFVSDFGGGDIFFTYVTNGAVNYVDHTTILATGVWYHLVVVNSFANGLIVYVNNVKVVGDPYTGNITNTRAFAIGAYALSNGDLTEASDAVIDEFGYWKDRALSDADVAALYNSGSGLAYPFGETGASGSKNMPLLGVG